ncbi:MAG: FeoB-associated Cys-rich membrane protein [Coprococcus sp.]
MEITLGTVIAVLAVLILCFFAVRSMVKDKKTGKSIQCGGNCSKCKGCH